MRPRNTVASPALIHPIAPHSSAPLNFATAPHPGVLIDRK